MLAKISEGIPDAIKLLKAAPFLAEYKYDGTRAQIHLLSDNTVKVFSRNCEDKTVSMPDVVAAIQAAAKGEFAAPHLCSSHTSILCLHYHLRTCCPLMCMVIVCSCAHLHLCTFRSSIFADKLHNRKQCISVSAIPQCMLLSVLTVTTMSHLSWSE